MSNVAAVIAGVRQALAQGRPEQARSLLQRALQRDANQSDLVHAMAIVLLQTGQGEQALYFAQRALALNPGEAEYGATLGGIQSSLGKHDDAVVTLGRTLTINPRAGNASLALANSLGATNRFAAGAAVCEKALALDPTDTQVSVAYARALVQLARAPEAVAELKRALELRPQDAGALEALPFAVNYLPEDDPETALEVHRRAGAMFEERAKPLAPSAPTRDPGRRLTVGFLSPDLRTHSVAFYIEPVLKHLDRSKVSTVCYSTCLSEDSTTQRLKGLSDHWRAVGAKSPAQIAEQVRADGVDILIDLAGYTDRARLPVFAMRPAPVQATYLGYPNTTGMTSVGYRIVDSITDPPGHEKFVTERLVRLDPCFLCYQAPDGAPEVSPPPSSSGKPVTFGSFNVLAKINDRVVGVWARLLGEVPGSRLLLKAKQLAEPEVRERTIERFVTRGVSADRVEVLPATETTAAHLALYSRMDIALDPFPYAGTTTTCEAMWMGVPVVTMAGRSHAARVGASLLSAVGLNELVASTEDEYIRLAKGLAADAKRLESLRSDLRGRLAGSVLCDGPGFARRFETALRGMWADFCTAGAGR